MGLIDIGRGVVDPALADVGHDQDERPGVRRQLVLGRLLLLDRLADLLGRRAASHGDVQRTKRDVIGVAPIEPLVERGHVDGGFQLVAELASVGDGLVGVVEVTQSDGVLGRATGSRGFDDGLVVVREESGQAVGGERAHDETRPRGIELIGRLEATEIRVMPIDGVLGQLVCGCRRADDRNLVEGGSDPLRPRLDVGDELRALSGGRVDGIGLIARHGREDRSCLLPERIDLVGERLEVSLDRIQRGVRDGVPMAGPTCAVDAIRPRRVHPGDHTRSTERDQSHREEPDECEASLSGGVADPSQCCPPDGARGCLSDVRGPAGSSRGRGGGIVASADDRSR